MTEKLVRGLGRWDLAAIAVNTVIGTGIFILPARVFGLVGSYSLFAFLACALIVGLIVVCFAEVSSRFESTGGMYLYAKEAFGTVVGFEVGWLYWVVRVASFAANCNAMLIYIGFFFPGATEGAARIAIICLTVGAMTMVNVLGIRESAWASNIFTVGKIVPLLLFAAVGLFFVSPQNFTFGELSGYGKFSEAVLLLIYAYVGFEAAVIPAGETKDPTRNLPFALFVTIGFCTVLFITIQIVAIGTLPELADSQRPLADAAGKFMGVFGGAFISLGAIISVLGNLNGGFLSASRLPFAMAEENSLPQAFAKTHSRFRTPYIAILATALVTLIITIQSSFYSAVTIATTTRLLIYAATCLALPVFRRRNNVPAARFTAPFGVAAAVLSIVLIVWLLANVKYDVEGLPIVVTAVTGLIIYSAYKLVRRSTANT